MRQKIQALSKQLHISDIGIIKAEVFYDLGKVLQKCGPVPMTEPDIERRINPFLIMKEAKSILVCVCSYYIGERDGNISKYAYGMDYHSVMQEKLGQICNLLKQHNYQAQAFSDNGVLNDRYLAHRAGLGFIGKNGFLIHPVYGTYTFIGHIITDCVFSHYDAMTDTDCAMCRRCIQACPGRALTEDGFCAERCLSYITQKKGELTPEEQALIAQSGVAWGCDICQDICSHNRHIKTTKIKEFEENLITTLVLADTISNKEFKQMYHNRAFTWRGKATIMRNLDIVNKKYKKN